MLYYYAENGIARAEWKEEIVCGIKCFEHEKLENVKSTEKEE